MSAIDDYLCKNHIPVMEIHHPLENILKMVLLFYNKIKLDCSM